MNTKARVKIPRKLWKTPTAKRLVQEVVQVARRIENKRRLQMQGQPRKIDYTGRQLFWREIVSIIVPDKMLIRIMASPKNTDNIKMARKVASYLYYKHGRMPVSATKDLDKVIEEVKARQRALTDSKTNLMTKDFDNALDEVAHKKRMPKNKVWQYGAIIDHHIPIVEILQVLYEAKYLLSKK